MREPTTLSKTAPVMVVSSACSTSWTEFSRECLAIKVARKLTATDVIDVLSDLFILRGVPGHVRSDNGPEFIAKADHELTFNPDHQVGADQ